MNLQERLAHVAEHLDAGDFSPADVRTVADALDDVRTLQARVQAALETMHRGEWSVAEARELADALRRWADDQEPEP